MGNNSLRNKYTEYLLDSKAEKIANSKSFYKYLKYKDKMELKKFIDEKSLAELQDKIIELQMQDKQNDLTLKDIMAHFAMGCFSGVVTGQIIFHFLTQNNTIQLVDNEAISLMIGGLIGISPGLAMGFINALAESFMPITNRINEKTIEHYYKKQSRIQDRIDKTTYLLDALKSKEDRYTDNVRDL